MLFKRLAQLFLSLTIFGDVDDMTFSDVGGQKITLPPPQQDTGTKLIPDPGHPFVHPGPNDQRGPCPGLNTMANHGFIPHNGIASFEELVEACMHVFNFDRDLAAFLSAFGIMSRGNSFTNQLSIGGPSPLVPPLPGNLDGPVTKGLATHGRFEGDVSMTRQDAAIGDNRNFQNDLFDFWLEHIGAFGDFDPTRAGNTSVPTIVNLKVMQEFKFNRFLQDQILNKKLEYHNPRFSKSYGEASFVLNLFANGTTGLVSTTTLGSFFRNQTFPNNWHRHAFPANLTFIFNTAQQVLGGHPILPGANDANGVYVTDPVTDENLLCVFYDSLLTQSVPDILVTKAKGLLKENADLLLDVLFKPFADAAQCQRKQPTAPANT